MKPLPTAFFLTLATTTFAAPWPAYHGSHSNKTTTEPVPLDSWKSDSPKTTWKTPTTAGFSSFVTGEDKVFTIVQKEDDGIKRETCIALDSDTGKTQWETFLDLARYKGGGNSGTRDNKGGDGPRSTPTFDSGRVYVIGSRLSVTCLDASDGSQVWQRDILKEHNGRNISWENAASPLIVGDRLFMAGGGKGQALLALDKTTGKTLWKAEDDKMTHATPISATILGQPQVIFFTQEGLVSTDPGSGRVFWRYPFPYKVSSAASPVVYEDIVYCSAGYGVGAGACKIRKIGTGFQAKEIWRTKNKNMNHWSTPIVKDGYLYGMFSFKDYGKGPVGCVDIRTGKPAWKEDGFGPGNVILAGKHIIALSDSGELIVIDPNPEKYDELRRADILDGKCWSTPILSGGRIYARSTIEGACIDLR